MSKNEFSDITESYPEYSEEHDTWSLRHIWLHVKGRRGTYSLGDCDDDGRPYAALTKREVDELVQQAPAKRLAYAEWVSRKGEDPCGEFSVEHEHTRSAKIRLHLAPGIGRQGLVCRSLRRSGRSVDLTKAPKGLLEFCELQKHGTAWVATHWKTAREAADEIKACASWSKARVTELGHCIIHSTAEWREPIPEEQVRRRLVVKARRFLRLAKEPRQRE